MPAHKTRFKLNRIEIQFKSFLELRIKFYDFRPCRVNELFRSESMIYGSGIAISLPFTASAT